MGDMLSVSRSELRNRRQQRRRQRRWRIVQSVWRSTLLIAMVSGLLWSTTQPVWVLRSATQIDITGNELLSTETIQTLLPIDYPQPLLDLNPGAIAAYLEAQGPIAQATVNRRLFPPGLTIQVQERRPVALLIRGSSSPIGGGLSAAQQSERSPSEQLGLVDEKGFWMSLSGYVALDQSLSLPSLKVLGMQPQQREEWAQLYQTLLQSPINVYEIDWRDPSNLILTTELGEVHFGPYSRLFPAQLQALDQLRNLPQHINISTLDYIDLRNPEIPLIQDTQPIIAPTVDPNSTDPSIDPNLDDSAAPF